MKNLDVKYFLNEDLTQDARNHRANIKNIAEGGRSLGHDTKITGNKLMIDSEIYQPDELGAVSPTILHAAKREQMLDDGIAFRGDRSIFSNFFPAAIIIDDVEYANVEQYFQHEKATICKADKQARKIMNKSNPWYVKIVGNRIETTEEWNRDRLQTLYRGIFAKFHQNIPLRQALLNTAGLNLYEATTDLYFVCGIDLDSPKWSTGDWPGNNATGKILMKVRSEFLAEESLMDPVSDNTLMNISGVSAWGDKPPDPKEQDKTLLETDGALVDKDSPVPMEDETVGRDEDWPLINKPTPSQPTKAVVTQHTLESGKAPKLNQGMPQFTPKRGHEKSRHQSTPKEKPRMLPKNDRLSEEDLLFLNNDKNMDHNKANNNGKHTKSATGKAKNRRSKKTPTSNRSKSGQTTLSDLSPTQRATFKSLGMHPDSTFVHNILSSQAKRK